MTTPLGCGVTELRLQDIASRKIDRRELEGMKIHETMTQTVDRSGPQMLRQIAKTGWPGIE
jgi:hypothetical protein